MPLQGLIAIAILILFSATTSFAQLNLSGDDKVDYLNPKNYEIGGISVTGVQHLDNHVIKMISGLKVGDEITIPGDQVSKAIDKLWKQGLFDHIKISIESIQKGIIFLSISLTEQPRLSKIIFDESIKKGEQDNLRDELDLATGDIVTEHLILNKTRIIKNNFAEKGFLFADVDLYIKKDPAKLNHVLLHVNTDKNKRTKINKIEIKGNKNFKEKKLKRVLKKTKEKKFYNVLASSKYIEEEYKTDKQSLLDKYHAAGYRDVKILEDTLYKYDSKTINIDISIREGKKYYFRKIKWVGNTKHSAKKLNEILKIKNGDVYNQGKLEQNLFMNMESGDVSSLYLDDGYLFFNLTPVEVNVEGDSIDLEVRIYEGKQAIVNKILIKGNTKTNDHVIIREIRTRPGELFNRSDIIRTQRELSQLRYFDAEKLGVNPKPNPADGTVDIEYVVEETSSDQVELSGGWGAGRIIGTLGVSFNNFSMRNFFKKGAWRPLPSGDGQKLSLRAQSNGTYYQSYNLSFTEPWLGGKKPNALSFSLFRSVQNLSGRPKGDPNRQAIGINGVSVGLGKRVRWPDDYFTVYHSVSYQSYNLENYNLTPSFRNGTANNLSYSFIFSRNSVGDNPYFPVHGSEISISGQWTPPYSIFSNKDLSSLTNEEKFTWTEFQKYKFKTSWFTKVAPKLIINTRTKFGFIGLYNRELGLTPFERFYLGGDGLSGYALDGREVVALRGYENSSLTPSNNMYTGGAIYNKYTMELRYPISLNPMATIYVLGYVEAGNAWLDFKSFDPFDVKRSAGLGVRIFLPMFGLLGLDWGYGFDEIPGQPDASGSQFHFSIGQSIE